MALEIKKKRASEVSSGKSEAIKEVTKEPQKRLNVMVDASKYKALKAKANDDDTNISALVNKWVNEYLSK